MSPRRFQHPASAALQSELKRVWVSTGIRIREARLKRRWTVQQLAAKAGVSRWVAYLAELGDSVSMEALVRLVKALGLRLDIELTDPNVRVARVARRVDPVHAAMGELEAGHFRAINFQIAVDEPYQHFQFAGRADVAAWRLDRRLLAHFENRTRFPDFLDTAGTFNAKRRYLGNELAKRVGMQGWLTEVHMIVALWSAEVLRALRAYPESFRSLCPDAPDLFARLWAGESVPAGRSSTLVVIDPSAVGRSGWFVGLDEVLSTDVRPRYRGYVDAVAALLAREAA